MSRRRFRTWKYEQLHDSTAGAKKSPVENTSRSKIRNPDALSCMV
jgi:hypothetical protein